ncbi:MAG: CDP-diacylglycerol--serine O-phosphatidyltransferase [Flavobacteriales bacterium]|nr:CDP-diacylglycerol--serine O-phosphatidyltransferase [Flavobacteriales bacterium]
MIRHLPNFLTLCNLGCGTLALALLLSGEPLHFASYLIVLAAIFDLADGWVARKLNASSPIGKDLDSLSDLVSFGVVPALLVYQMVAMVDLGLFHEAAWLRFIPLLIAPLSALRLARFNHDTRQTTDFIGLPTPAHALFWISWPLILHESANYDLLAGVWSLPVSQESFTIFMVVLPALLNSGLHLFSLKFKTGGIAANKDRVVFLALAAALVIVCGLLAGMIWLSLPLIILLYLVYSVITQYLL